MQVRTNHANEQSFQLTKFQLGKQNDKLTVAVSMMKKIRPNCGQLSKELVYDQPEPSKKTAAMI